MRWHLRAPAAVAIVVAVFVSCTIESKLTLRADLLSFMSSPPSIDDASFPTLDFVYIGLIPRVEISPGSFEYIEERRGLLIGVPEVPHIDTIPDDAAQQVELTIEFGLALVISCSEFAGALPSSRLLIYASTPDVSDVYSGGEEIASVDVPRIESGAEGIIRIVAEFRADAGHLSLIEEGLVRVGALIEVQPGDGTVTRVDLEVSLLEVSVSGYPYYAVLGSLGR